MNNTIKLSDREVDFYFEKVEKEIPNGDIDRFTDKIFCADSGIVLKEIPDESIDLIIIDPPYNLNKNFNSSTFKKVNDEEYEYYILKIVSQVYRILKSAGSFYICCDWKSSSSVHRALALFFTVKNRITWQREKGKGSKSNWKNCIEDIYFCVKGSDYYFNPDAVKIKKRVLAPYTNKDGSKRDWERTQEGDYRLTYHSNFWNDITIPFWSMKENTEHPTQKPEKLIAKLILASSKENDIVLDCFLGSGTTAVVAKKLKRKFIGVELDKKYCAISEKRLELANTNTVIQGYTGEYFLERGGF